MCVHAQRIVSDRGSQFWLCRRGLTDPAYAKYPRLPVMQCRGFESIDELKKNDDDTPHASGA